MLESKELRIGNIVQSLEDYDEFIIDEGWQIDNSRIYKPIPLSEEWLVKMGFERMLGLDIWFIGDVCGRHLQIVNDEQMFIARLTGRTLREVTSVHDIQNLYFALTGEELTIKQ